MGKGRRRPVFQQLGIVPELTTLPPLDYSAVLNQPLGRAVNAILPELTPQTQDAPMTGERAAALLHHDNVASIETRLSELHRIGAAMKYNGGYFRKLPPPTPVCREQSRFEQQYGWAAKFEDAWISLFRRQGYGNMERATLIEDQELGVDFIDRQTNRRVMVRVESWHDRKQVWKIRCFSEETGGPAELRKLLLDLNDRYYYAISNGQETGFDRWIEIDLHRSLKCGLFESLRPITGRNFAAISFENLFKAGVIVDWSWR